MGGIERVVEIEYPCLDAAEIRGRSSLGRGKFARHGAANVRDAKGFRKKPLTIAV